MNLALVGAAKIHGVRRSGRENALRGRIHIGPEIDYLEQAFDESKYGNFSPHPYLEVTIPSLTDASLAPVGKHVMSVYMQYAPFHLKYAGLGHAARCPGQHRGKNAEPVCARISRNWWKMRRSSPRKTWKTTYGLSGGHIFHGELALDQFFTMRPLLDWARYRTPIQNLYLCGSGTHPGAGLTGGSGANAAREILKELGR